MYDQQSVGGSNVPRDDEFAEGMHVMASEAAERVTFHRIEIERWDRIGRAAQSALGQLQGADPVPPQTPDGFLEASPNRPTPARF